MECSIAQIYISYGFMVLCFMLGFAACIFAISFLPKDKANGS